MKGEILRFKVTGQLSHQTPVDVDDAGTSITISDGKEEIRIQNIGSKVVYGGGEGVTSSDYGFILTPRMVAVFDDCPPDFKIYLICAAGETTKIGVTER